MRIEELIPFHGKNVIVRCSDGSVAEGPLFGYVAYLHDELWPDAIDIQKAGYAISIPAADVLSIEEA